MHLAGSDYVNIHRYICLSSDHISRMPAGLGSISSVVVTPGPQRDLFASLLPQSGLYLRYSGMTHLQE